MHTVEQELVSATAYKAQRKFKDRQDYLGSILNAVMKLDNDDFDELSDDAAAWANAAVTAKNSNEDIPDFDEIDPDDEDEDSTEDDDPEDGDSEDDTDPDESEEDENIDSETGEVLEEEPEAGENVEDEAEAVDEDEETDEPISSKMDDTEPLDLEDESLEVEQTTTEKPKKEKKVPNRRFAKNGRRLPNKRPPKTKEVTFKPEKPKADHLKKFAPRPTSTDVILDKWGCMEGGKNSEALALFEKGATTAEVKAKIGGTYYNLLKKMSLNGHRLEKTGSHIKLIHKDNFVVKKSKK